MMELQGFRSHFLLEKLGHELADALADTLVAPLPDELASALSRLDPEPIPHRDVLDLRSISDDCLV
jgi:hypothetical protein